MDALTWYFMAHGVTDPVVAAHKAAIAIGTVVKREALVMAFSDTFAVVGFALLVAIAILLTRKVANVAGVAPLIGPVGSLPSPKASRAVLPTVGAQQATQGSESALDPGHNGAGLRPAGRS
ncbi:hypothetical protein JQ604_03270 [Bradyrhizobium jicamae]|uniref:hypothetical protein n=1 Tax=Bradyrhizobium jicamae TaxID=280332 RepID=UPI001BA80C12|nr:hypothetical protein [Bradyrhizobium jicamae]MBR0751191.1 hypothetical protein [Bradyrhizobium jicamae]